jgi:tetratricopeptide (TPR) repeat protein
MSLEDLNLEGKNVQIEEKGDSITVSVFVKGNNSSTIKGESLSKEEIVALRNKFLAEFDGDMKDEDQAINFAARLMDNEQYNQAIAYFSAIAIQYPHEQGLCECQIGAAYYFLGDYEQAIEYYLAAREHGMNEDMMDDNIWEACETIFQKTNDLSAIEQYLKLCPEGKYIEDAKILLG